MRIHESFLQPGEWNPVFNKLFYSTTTDNEV